MQKWTRKAAAVMAVICLAFGTAGVAMHKWDEMRQEKAHEELTAQVVGMSEAGTTGETMPEKKVPEVDNEIDEQYQSKKKKFQNMCAAAVSDTVPTDDKSVIPDAEVGCNDLGVFVKIAVTGCQHGCTGSSVSSHGTIGDLVGGGISGSAAVQRVNRHSGSVGQHGRLQRLHAASSTVRGKNIFLAPGAVSAVIATVHDTISGREVQQVVAARSAHGIGGVDAAPEHDGLAVAAYCRGWGQIRRAVIG